MGIRERIRRLFGRKKQANPTLVLLGMADLGEDLDGRGSGYRLYRVVASVEWPDGRMELYEHTYRMHLEGESVVWELP